MTEESVKISLKIATDAAEIALKNLKKQTEDNNSVWNIFKANFAAGFALDSLKALYAKVSGFVSSVIDESSKAQQSVQNMNVALQNAGIYSEKTSQHFQQLGDAIELTTAFSGDAVESSVALLASLTKLDKNGITAATKAAVDLAATLNIDLGSASDMIVKAINGNVTAFGKLGIEIQKGRTDSENLANTLQALSGQQGAAEKQANTYRGAIAKLDNQEGKLLESLGNLITKSSLVQGSINGLTEVYAYLSSAIEDNFENIKLLTQSFAISTAVVAAGTAAWLTYTAVTGGVSVALGALTTAVNIAWAAITGPVGLAVGAIVGLGVAIFAVVKYWDDIKIKIYEATAAVIEYAAKAANLFSSDTAKKMRDEANAFRDKAQAIREAQIAEEDAKKNAANNTSKTPEEIEAEKLKQQQQLEQMRQYYAERTAARNEHNASLLLSEQDQNLKLQELKAAHETAMFEISGEYDGQALENQLEQERAMLLSRQQFEKDQLQASIDAQKAKALLIEDDQQREKALREAGYKAELSQKQLSGKQQLEQVKLQNKTEQQLEKQKMNNKKDTWNTLLSLQSSSNKELAMAGKAFALYDIAVNTPVAIGKAMAAYPPPFNFAAAALVGAAMATQAAQVSGLNFATGGIVPGSSYSGDKVAANVNSREMILNLGQQKRLFDIANGSGANTTTNELLIELIGAVRNSTSIQIDGREIVSVVRDGLQSGRTI